MDAPRSVSSFRSEESLTTAEFWDLYSKHEPKIDNIITNLTQNEKVELFKEKGHLVLDNGFVIGVATT